MKQKTVLLVILCMVFLTACGSRSESVTVTEASPWPSHAPGATPYVRLEIENNEMPASEDTQNTASQYESYEDFINSVYTTEGDLYAKKWELAMFKEELPQDEPYSFAVHTNAMLTGSDTSDDHIALAKKFAELGCEAIVKEMRSVEDGKNTLPGSRSSLRPLHISGRSAAVWVKNYTSNNCIRVLISGSIL